MGKHLSLSDRAIIEKLLAQDYTFAYIAKQLGILMFVYPKTLKNTPNIFLEYLPDKLSEPPKFVQLQGFVLKILLYSKDILSINCKMHQIIKITIKAK